MALGTLSSGHPFALSERDGERLRARLRDGLARARREGAPVLCALTVEIAPDCDPTAVVCAARQRGESWFAFEQPERGRAALAGLGAVARLEGEGRDRFKTLARQWRELIARALFDPVDAPAGAGLVAVGGFAFADDGGRAPHWRGFAPGSLVVPELALARGADDADGRAAARLTVALLAHPDDDLEQLSERVGTRLASLRPGALPLLDPAPSGRSQIVSAMPPEHYIEAVARAVERIRAGEIEKIVLGREVQVHAPLAHDPAAVLGVLREAFPACSVFGVGRGEAAFVGASPELLIRRQGLRAGTLALAGSTRRSADPAVDAHLGEQLLRSQKDREEHAIVARRIERTLRARSVWVIAAPEPVLVRVANIQHLATPIRAQLAEPVDLLELAGLMHPTPAVGGEPHGLAARMIPALEGLDRGWYAGPLGWTDASGDGELCVALRCALLDGPLARCYAGVGVVRDSDPAAELSETELKLQALLPVLAA